MGTLDQLNANGGPRARILGMGFPGTEKTGSVAALLNSGRYKVRMIDLDGNLDPLFTFTRPEFRSNIDVVSLEDVLQVTETGVELAGQSKIITGVDALLSNWKYGSGDKAVDLGQPASWGPDTVLVLDSLSAYGRAALRRAISLAGHNSKNRSWKDWGAAMETVEGMVERITSTKLGCHVVVFAHRKVVGPKLVALDADDDEASTGVAELDEELRQAMAKQIRLVPTQNCPSIIGKALAPEIAQHFSTVLLYDLDGENGKERRVIYTQPRESFPIKVPAKVAPVLPADTGLLTVLDAIRGLS